jgi:hypothetical protein
MQISINAIIAKDKYSTPFLVTDIVGDTIKGYYINGLDKWIKPEEISWTETEFIKLGESREWTGSDLRPKLY